MARHLRYRGASRRSFLSVVALLLVAGLLSTGPAAAHTFTRSDGNDSASKIDLRSVSVSHAASGAVVHKVRTYNTWTPQSLELDSFFLIGINKDSDPAYERCAFIYYTTRLRGQLSNCGANFIRYLPVAKLNGTTAKITIPKSEVGSVYWWYGASYWAGARPCRNVCVDFAPNRLPDVLHDLEPPVVTMPEPNLVRRVWDAGTTSDFIFPFSLADAHSGIGSWTIERSPASSPPVWSLVQSGTGGGEKSPTIVGTPPGRFKFRVVAVDRQGNQAFGDPRHVYVPTDISVSGPGDFSDDTVTETPVSEAWGGGFVPLDVGESYTLEVTKPTDGCLVEFVGPGTGDWMVNVLVQGNTLPLDATNFEESPRQTLLSWCVGSSFPSTTFTLTVMSGSGFGIDAVLI